MEQVTDLMLKALQKPLQMKWRVQRAFPNKTAPTHVIMIGYIDSRDVQSRLDECVGMHNWQSRYYECKGKQFCEIGLRINGEWVFKGDSGSPSSTEKEKGETSDSFKRAAVHWGINRIGYQVGEVKLLCKMYGDKPYPCDETGAFIKGERLNEVCNKLANVDELGVEFENSFNEMKSTLEMGNVKKTTVRAARKTSKPEMP
jgi:hypothetical protein